MSAGFEIRGTEDLARVRKSLKDAGDPGKGLRKELSSGLNRATKDTRKELKAAIPGALPSKGGLADLVSSTAVFTTSATTGSRGQAAAGVRIRGHRRGLKGASLRRMNAGTVGHPVFGNRKVWAKQTAGVRAGFLTDTFQHDKPHLQIAVIKAIRTVRNRIYRRA